jgi:MFS family permease
VQFGMLLCLGSGVFLLLAALLRSTPALSLLLLVMSRMTLGIAESLVGTGSISWGIGRVGAGHTARIMSWNGIASYSALAVGAPLGVAMVQHWGFVALSAFTVATPIVGYLIARAKTATEVVAHGETLAFRHVLRRVLSFGVALGLGSVGFGSIATFITLYYASFGWADAAWCLTAFGAAFVSARLLFAHTIRRFGGFRVAIVSCPIEFIGLAIIWLAPSPAWAMLGAALTGFGFSLIYPALAVEAVALVPMRNRGAAIGAYTVFLDISLGLTGPLAGLIIGQFGYPSVYLFAAISTLLALIIVIRLSLRAAPQQVH